MNDYKALCSPIKSVSKLAEVLDLEVKDLRTVLCMPFEDRYNANPQPKTDGSERIVYNPHPAVRLVQRRINNRIFSKKKNVIRWPSYLYGSIPNSVDEQGKEIKKDYVTCAGVHCGAKSVLRIDVKNFFDNIHYDKVYDIFTNFFDYSKEVSEILTNICMRHNNLPQGGLTSGYIACLYLFDVETAVVKRLANKDLKYTRFVDDIVVSSQKANYDFSFANKVVCDMLHTKDLPVNEDKTTVQRITSEPMVVHGLRISFKEPRLPVGEAKQIRAAVHNIEKLASEPGYRTTNTYKKAYNKCIGRVNKLSRVKHNQHKQLIERLSKIRPLATYSTVARAKSRVRRLEHKYQSSHKTYWYRGKYYQAQEKINIIQRNYPSIAKILREKMKAIKPPPKRD